MTQIEMINRAAIPVLILAGQRAGKLDPLARASGVSHKCLVPVLGKPMISRVLQTIDEAFPNSLIFVSVEKAAGLDALSPVACLMAENRLRLIEAEVNLVDSIQVASEATGFPLLVTTADNVLVTVNALRSLNSEAETTDAAAVAVIAPKEAIQAAHPAGKGRYYEFRNGGYSNCNLFWLASADALKAAEVFRGGGQFLKVPGRMLKAFGLLNLLLFQFRARTLEQTFEAVSKRFRVKVRPLVLYDGRLAIDVDDARSLQITEDILRGQSD